MAPTELEQAGRQWAQCLGEASCGVDRIFMPNAETVRVRLANGKTWEIKAVGDSGPNAGMPSSLEIKTL